MKVKTSKASTAVKAVLGENHKQARLSDLLDQHQIDECVRIINLTSVDDIERTRLLKAYLQTLKEQLEARGVLPAYLAYVLMANAANFIRPSKQSRDEEPPYSNN